MARPRRVEFPGAVYHVTSRGHALHDLVTDDQDRTTWLALLAHVEGREPRVSDSLTQVGVVQVLGLWFLHKTS